MLNKLNHTIPDLLLKSKYHFFRHALIQVVVLLITINVFWDDPTEILPERFGVWVVYSLLINGIIYTNMYLLVPRLLLKERTQIYLLLSFLLILCAMFCMGVLENMTNDSDTRLSITPVPAIIGITSGFASLTLLTVGLTTLQLFKYHMGNRKKIDELENVTMQIELANLQNQINPHFLFNMLNNANIMVNQNVDKSSYILSKLKTLLQYQVDEGSKEKVRLKDELAFIEDYLELEKTRRDRFNYTIQLDGNADIVVPPLLFIPFIENAVKHNPENDSYVKIIFRIVNNDLFFECKNTKTKLSHRKKEGGIGLVNIKKRLDMLFDKNYKLILADGKDIYTVKMELKI